MDLKSLQPPPPNKADQLFTCDEGLTNASIANSSSEYSSFSYRYGYRRAGKILAEWAASNGEASHLVFPICFVYRHYVELTLKRLIALGCGIANRRMAEGETRVVSKHDLRKLWNTFRAVEVEVINKTGGNPRPPEDMEGIEAYLDQLHTSDQGSYSFRYAVGKSGDATLGGVKHINLLHFAQCMECLCEYLQGFDTYYCYLANMDAES